VFTCDSGYRIALTYGRDVDWLKNILATGTFEPGATGVRQLLQAISAGDYVEVHPV
jgi:hypothetical protein